MAWRDTRASRRRLLLYSLSIVLGVAALIGISSLGDGLRAAVDAQAKGLLGADLSRLMPTGKNTVAGLSDARFFVA